MVALASNPSSAMTFSDFLGFTSMTLLLIGALNWGVVAIRYASGSLPNGAQYNSSSSAGFLNLSGHDVYDVYPTPDLIDLFSASPGVQMFVYWVVFFAGVFYLGLFVYMSIETTD